MPGFRIALCLVALSLAGGCSNGPTPPTPTTHVVNAYGDTLPKAQEQAIRMAQVRCADDEPIVIARQAYPANPALAIASLPAAPPPGDAIDLAAATHEGESPAIRLGFRCIPAP